MAENQPLPSNQQKLRRLRLLAFSSAVMYGWISWLSWKFQFDAVSRERPTLLTVGLFGLLFAIYLLSIRVVQQLNDDRRCLRLILASSILFRVMVVFSVPILEIDIYRYIWDGAVTSNGVSPFRYAPEVVKDTDSVVDDSTLQRLVNLRNSRPSLAEVLDRIHFAELPSVYPMVSQFVFALAYLTTPEQANVYTHLLVMKAWLIAFDLGTLWMVVKLLRIAGRSPSLAIMYGWCPLLIKEVANSGHLDAIAVFFTTLTVLIVTKHVLCVTKSKTVSLASCLATVVTFALAVGSKLYPIVLAPILGAIAIRMLGVRQSLLWSGLCCCFIAVLLTPMAYQGNSGDDPGKGLKTFLKRWEMNDFLFLITVENMRPDDGRSVHEKPWFTFVPDQWRRSLAEIAAPFQLARVTTACVFLAIAVWIAKKVAFEDRRPEDQVAGFVEGVFLTLAWFWLLAPTQNPWYWTWTLPFLPFTRNSAWRWVSGLVFAYYLRFWLIDHYSSTAVLGGRYAGPEFFDFVVAWIEFLPWFSILLIRSIGRSDPQRPCAEHSK